MFCKLGIIILDGFAPFPVLVAPYILTSWFFLASEMHVVISRIFGDSLSSSEFELTIYSFTIPLAPV